MPAYYLEALTITLGLILLWPKPLSPAKTRPGSASPRPSAWPSSSASPASPSGRRPSPRPHGRRWPLWNFYQFDALARFYKVFALVCTMLVVLLSVDYRKILARFTDHPGSENGTGEYYALPVFACAGMMLLASAKDLAGAFVALELVTITFYILVAYMRRNVGSLEAGVKYLILGALSTGFLVYGIAWVYGSTGTMSLTEIVKSATPNSANPTAPALRHRAGDGRPRLQDRRRAHASLDPGCLSGCAHPHHRVSISRLQGRRFHPVDPFPRTLPRQRAHPRPGAQPAAHPRRRHAAFRQPRRHSANQLQAPARLLVHRPRRVPAAGAGRRQSRKPRPRSAPSRWCRSIWRPICS